MPRHLSTHEALDGAGGSRSAVLGVLQPQLERALHLVNLALVQPLRHLGAPLCLLGVRTELSDTALVKRTPIPLSLDQLSDCFVCLALSILKENRQRALFLIAALKPSL